MCERVRDRAMNKFTILLENFKNTKERCWDWYFSEIFSCLRGLVMLTKQESFWSRSFEFSLWLGYVHFLKLRIPEELYVGLFRSPDDVADDKFMSWIPCNEHYQFRDLTYLVIRTFVQALYLLIERFVLLV